MIENNEAPFYRDYYMQLFAIDQSLTRKYLPTNRAIR